MDMRRRRSVGSVRRWNWRDLACIGIRTDLPAHRQWHRIRRPLVSGICPRHKLRWDAWAPLHEARNVECSLFMMVGARDASPGAFGRR